MSSKESANRAIKSISAIYDVVFEEGDDYLFEDLLEAGIEKSRVDEIESAISKIMNIYEDIIPELENKTGE